PYAFTARPWELKKTESIDVMDALGSNIRVDAKGREVMRILPRNHDGVNEEWLSDKSRFIWDGLRRQRLDRPYLREGGKLRPATWPEALAAAATAMKGRKVAALAGDLAPVEAMFALQGLMAATGGSTECRVDGAALPIGDRAAYAGTARIEDIDTAERILLIGTNPRAEMPVLNARIRKAWLAGAEIALVGEAVDLTYDYTHVGDDTDALGHVLAEGGSDEIRAKASLVIVGQGALKGANGAAVLNTAKRIAENTESGFLMLHTAAARVGGMDIGFATEGGMDAALQGAEVVYALGVDEVEIEAGPFVIYQGSHGDRGAHRADLILPAAAYTEENGLFVNTEGRPQLAMRASFAPGQAKENWAIIRALSAELGATLPYDTMAALRDALIKVQPHLGLIDEVAPNEWQKAATGRMTKSRITGAVANHYQTNPIARASAVMAELAANAAARSRKMAAE
ncbi:MAG: molybdopterin-dependent oxidoreductase, partial [Rhodobacteraceae bacterium]|nr:molybdopterin-dependent oxidoreductase [Paracoccaceae bacterium]